MENVKLFDHLWNAPDMTKQFHVCGGYKANVLPDDVRGVSQEFEFLWQRGVVGWQEPRMGRVDNVVLANTQGQAPLTSYVK